jgi:hypothetical protein
MAGPDFLYEGIFKQAGVIRVHSIEDLYIHGWALSVQPPLLGRMMGEKLGPYQNPFGFPNKVRYQSK